MTTNNVNPDKLSEKVKESIIIRGIAASLQAMVLPSWENLREAVRKFGFDLIKKD